MRALKALKLTLSLIRAILLLALPASLALFLYLKYVYKRWRVRREAQKVFNAHGLPENTARELLEILVPDVGGLLEWVNLMKSENCC